MRISDLPLFVVAAATCALGVAYATPYFPAPSIAIVTSPLVDCPGPLPAHFDGVSSCIRGTYVQWLHAAGIRVVPLPWNAPHDTKLSILQQVNGVLFAGGSMDSHPKLYSEFWAEICQILDITSRMNNDGDHMVVVGICQGFQMLCACTAKRLTIVTDGFTGMYPLMMALNLTDAALSSQLFGKAPADVLDAFTGHNVTLNYHHEGIVPSAFAAGTALGQAFDVTSTNTDSSGRAFVSTIEAAAAPVFGFQWHPEWPPFDFSDEAIGKSPEAILVSQFVSHFVRDHLSRNNHTFPTAEALEAVVVDRCPVTYQGYGVLRYWVGGTQAANHDGAFITLAVVLGVVASAVFFLAGAGIGRLVERKRSSSYSSELQ